jgi:hypothetical protein
MFDYVSGDVPAKVFEWMPANSELFIGGNLSGLTMPINTGNILFTSKKIRTLALFTWFSTITQEEK